jgi:mannan endo-1,4-beta-mannosidase
MIYRPCSGSAAPAGIVPILMVADLTCDSDADQVNTTLIPWWTSREVVSLITAHQQYLIVNIANEAGAYRWSQNKKTALAAYNKAYRHAIARIRASGVKVPLLIDAPDCGTSLDAFLAVGRELMNSDPDKNVLFSAHAYWAAYDGMSFVDSCIAAGLPILFGEIANKQDEQIDGKTVLGYYDLDGNKTGPGKTKWLSLSGFAFSSEVAGNRLAGVVLGTGSMRGAPNQQRRDVRFTD